MMSRPEALGRNSGRREADRQTGIGTRTSAGPREVAPVLNPKTLLGVLATAELGPYMPNSRETSEGAKRQQGRLPKLAPDSARSAGARELRVVLRGLPDPCSQCASVQRRRLGGRPAHRAQGALGRDAASGSPSRNPSTNSAPRLTASQPGRCQPYCPRGAGSREASPRRHVTVARS
jgi:hypothetical protein